MASESPNLRRIITIDDNEDIHRDYEAVLTPPERPADLDDLEAALFGEPTETSAPKSDVRYQLDHALQGQEGFEKVSRAVAEGNPYALAFVDMRMPPGWDGMETIREIWKADPEIQIVICTAFSDYDLSNIRNHVRRTDSLLILKKPFDTKEVEQLASAMTEKWVLARQAAAKMEELERLVQERTSELRDLNIHLLDEVARRKASEEMLRKLSFVDGLTGISNRRMFDEMLTAQWEKAIQEGASIAVIMFDVDHFKRYNDTWGHQAGDICLKRVSSALHESIERRHDLLARYGGEEFVALLPDTDLKGAALVGERMRKAVEALNIKPELATEFSGVTISAGCAAVVPTRDLAPKRLLEAADRALYRAKEQGRNQLVVEESI